MNALQWSRIVQEALRGRTEQELADFLEVTQQTINSWRRGDSIPPKKRCERLLQKINSLKSGPLKEEAAIYGQSDAERWIAELEERCRNAIDAAERGNPDQKDFIESAIRALFTSHSEIITRLCRPRRRTMGKTKKANAA